MTSLAMLARQVGGWYNIGRGLFEADPAVEAPPDGWQDAYDSGDVELIQAWYENNTGHLADGFDAGDLWVTDLVDVTVINSAWLTANEGANVVDNGGGDWTVTGMHATKLRIDVSNIHFEHCFIDRSSIHDLNGGGVDVYDPNLATYDGVENVNITFKWCTLKGGTIAHPTLKSLTSNVATLTIGTHAYEVGEVVYVTLFPFGGSPQFSGQRTITAVTGTTISFASVATDVASTATEGVVTYSLEGDYGDAQSYFCTPEVSDWDNYKYSFCQAYHWPAVFKFYRGSTAEYCYVHNLDLYGADPHNTSCSIRGDHCRAFRNFFTDGTSSDISLYADLQPYDDFEVIDNILMVDPTHAIYEVNFPNRSPEFWNVLSTGMSRIFKGNKMQRGAASDLQYFSEISANALIDGTPLFGGAARPEDRVFGVPSVVAGFTGGFAGYSNPSETLVSFPYTPSNNSTLFLFHGIGQAGHTTTPVPAVTDTSGGTWAKVTNTQTPVENAPADLPAYGISTVLWTVETGSGEAFRKTTADPYNTTNTAYEAMIIFELTGVKNMLLVQPRALSASGHALGFGSSQRTCASGSLGSPATPGNDVFFCVAYGHDTTPFYDVDDPAVPAGWTLVGVIRERKTALAVFWRNDWNGTSVSISDLGVDAGSVVTTLVEFSS